MAAQRDHPVIDLMIALVAAGCIAVEAFPEWQRNIARAWCRQRVADVRRWQQWPKLGSGLRRWIGSSF